MYIMELNYKGAYADGIETFKGVNYEKKESQKSRAVKRAWQ